MLLKSLSLNNFRNIKSATYYFNPFLTIIAGQNSLGKTNILEAIYFSFNGRGIREDRQTDLINMSTDNMSVKAIIENDADKIEFNIRITKKELIEKSYQINKLKKTGMQYKKYCLPVVIFSPQLLNVIEGSPSRRRRYIDTVIGNYDPVYKRNINIYEQSIRKRNKILEKINNIIELQKQLVYWDQLLIKTADYICRKREEFCQFLNENNKVKDYSFNIVYQKKLISSQTLVDTLPLQMMVKTTVVGPHRDDFDIQKIKNNKNYSLHSFGSRSEERLALFWLTLNELALIEQFLRQKPILLLDDIFSELDLINKSIILELINKYQTVLTTTETEIVNLITLPHSIINLK